MKLFSRYVTLRLTEDRGSGALSAQGWRARVVLKACADIAGKAVMLVITVAAARRLNADPFGILAFAMATGWLLSVATDAGLSMHLAREVARDQGRNHRLVVDVIGLRTGLAFLAATLLALATPYMVPQQWRMQFIVIVLAQLAGGVTETVAHYFRGIQRSEIESIIHASHRAVMLVWALIVLSVWRRLDYLGVAMLVPALAAMAVSIVIAMDLSSRRSDASVSQRRLTLSMFGYDALPLGAGVLLSALYFRCDVYFIEHWHGFQPVGGYNAVFRLVEALRLLPAAVLAVTFPLLVQSADTQIVKRIATALTIIGTGLALICAIASSWLVPFIYGDTYASAAPSFAILSLALPLFFLNYALTHQVIGWNGQRTYLFVCAAALVVNIAVNIALVPTQGIAGAAVGTVVTEFVVTAGCVFFLLNHRVARSRGPLALNHRPEPSR